MRTAAIRGRFRILRIQSSVLVARTHSFALLRDGNGNTQCYRYEVSDPEKRTLLYETAENISLVQYQDGYLYLMENQASQTSTGEFLFKRIAADAEADAAANAAEAQNALFTVEEEPGMTNDFSMYGNFYVTGNQAYCQQFKDYGVYLGEKTLDDAAGGEATLLEPVLFQSPIRELGHVEAQSETLKSADGSRELGSVYAERLVFDGEGDAVEAMNQTMQELQASVLSAARTDSMNLDTEMSIDTAESDGSEEETLPQEADAAQPVYSMALTIDGDDAITYLDDHYVCVRADGYEYTGGAHGTPFRQYFVFDRETGARLSLSDVVENPVEELQAKVGAAFRELADSDPSFETIVAFAENCADPHAVPSDKILEEGMSVIVDMGCKFEGYCSDMTRTYFIGKNTMEDVYDTVLRANLAGIAAVKPGVRFCDIDRACRQVIEEAGYGSYFIHRTGHGIGLSVHEPFDVSAVDEIVVEEGMCFSIEPGIYLPGVGGWLDWKSKIWDSHGFGRQGKRGKQAMGDRRVLNHDPKDQPVL